MVLLNVMANILSHEDLGQRQSSDENALDARKGGAGSLIQADGMVGAIIELGRARGFVDSDLLRMLNRTTVLQIE